MPLSKYESEQLELIEAQLKAELRESLPEAFWRMERPPQTAWYNRIWERVTPSGIFLAVVLVVIGLIVLLFGGQIMVEVRIFIHSVTGIFTNPTGNP